MNASSVLHPRNLLTIASIKKQVILASVLWGQNLR
jgi:hypothetical protein